MSECWNFHFPSLHLLLSWKLLFCTPPFIVDQPLSVISLNSSSYFHYAITKLDSMTKKIYERVSFWVIFSGPLNSRWKFCWQWGRGGYICCQFLWAGRYTSLFLIKVDNCNLMQRLVAIVWKFLLVFCFLKNWLFIAINYFFAQNACNWDCSPSQAYLSTVETKFYLFVFH